MGPTSTMLVVDSLRLNEDGLTLRKYFFGRPSDNVTEIFAVFVQADIPQDSAELTFVPGGMTIRHMSNAQMQSIESLMEVYHQVRPCGQGNPPRYLSPIRMKSTFFNNTVRYLYEEFQTRVTI